MQRILISSSTNIYYHHISFKKSALEEVALVHKWLCCTHHAVYAAVEAAPLLWAHCNCKVWNGREIRAMIIAWPQIPLVLQAYASIIYTAVDTHGIRKWLLTQILIPVIHIQYSFAFWVDMSWTIVLSDLTNHIVAFWSNSHIVGKRNSIASRVITPGCFTLQNVHSAITNTIPL